VKISSFYIFIIFVFLLSTEGFNQQINSVSVGNIGPGEIQYKGFQLKEDGTIKVTGQIAAFNDKDDDWFKYSDDDDECTKNLIFYCFIFDSKKLNLIWNTL
jgi:hypothetical protein